MSTFILCVIALNVLFVPVWCWSIARAKRLRSLRRRIEHVFFEFIA